MQIMMCREQFVNARIGCCGKVRQDAIYPLDGTMSEQDFIKYAYPIVEKYNPDKPRIGTDTYSIEYYMGDPEKDERGNGPSVYLLQYKNGRWHYYRNGNLVFTVKDARELKDKWISYLE